MKFFIVMYSYSRCSLFFYIVNINSKFLFFLNHCNLKNKLETIHKLIMFNIFQRIRSFNQNFDQNFLINEVVRNIVFITIYSAQHAIIKR